MTDPWAEARSDVLLRFEKLAGVLFEKQPSRRSILLAVAQYWNDGADDEVHATIVCSTRETPVWPHECRDTSEEDGKYLNTPLLTGEECGQCHDWEELHLNFHGADGDPFVLALELFCREGSDQEMEDFEAYAPYAIARRIGEGANEIQLEIVGVPRRPANTVLGPHPDPGDPWADAKCRALFHEICRAPGDDGPRVVLSDLLRVERPDDPRGEAIALSLVGAPDAATRTRRDELIAAHLVAWIHPLGAVIPPGCATFERGFLSRARIYARDTAACDLVSGHPAWGTVEVLQFSPGSYDLIDQEMTALRDVGPIGELGLEALSEADRPWAIERLHAEIDGVEPDPVIDKLARMTNLPRLRELVLTVPEAPALERVVADLVSRAPWSSQLEQLTLVVTTLAPFARWSALRPAHAWLAVVLADDDRQPSGWQLRLGPDDAVEISQVGWHPQATMVQLAAIIQQLPPSAAIQLRSTPYRRCGPDEGRYVHDHTDRDVAIE
jgi:hypothetical protein